MGLLKTFRRGEVGISGAEIDQMSVIVDEDAGCDGIAPVDQFEVKRVVIDTYLSHAGGEEHR